jgi:hypothetical protein
VDAHRGKLPWTGQKDQILEAIGEGTSETNLEELRKLKKAELVATAEERLAESRWRTRKMGKSGN